MFNWKKIKVSKDLDTLRRDSLKENEVSEIKSVDTWKLWKTKKNWNKYSESFGPTKPEDFSDFLEKLDFEDDYKPIDKFEDDISAYEDWLDNDCYGNDTTTPEAKHAISGSIADLGAQEHLIDDSDLDRYIKDDLHKRLNDVVDRLSGLLKESTIVVSEADDMAQSAKINGARKVEVPESEPTGIKKQDFNLEDNNTGVEKTSIDSKKDPFKESLLDDFDGDPIALRDYLFDKEKVTALDKEEMYTLQDLIQQYGKPDEEESVNFDEVYDAAIDALDWYLYEHENCKCTDEQKEEAAKNMAQTIINDGEWDPDNEYIFDGMIEGALEYLGVKLNESEVRESKLKESQEKDITIDFPITVNEKGRIKANDAKKLLKYLAANKMLRLGRTWYVKDPAGRETCWSLMKGYFDEYVFSCEITDSIEDENGNYDELDWYNGLSFSKSNGKLTDFEWESYKVN